MKKRGTQEEQAAQKKIGIRMIKRGDKTAIISETLGVSKQTVCNWRNALKNSESGKVKDKVRGRSEGEKRKLTPDQEEYVKASIRDYTPDQLKFPFALWSRQAVKELIKEKFDIDIPLTTLSRYLKSWGFSCQKPQKRAYERKDAKVQKWLNEDYPEIKKRAKKEKAEIHWADETHVQSVPNNLRGFAPKGKTPILKHSAKKLKINMISSITNQGLVRFMTYKDSMNAAQFIKFLKRLIQSSENKIFLIVDNLRVHHAIKVKEWGEENKTKIEIFYLPPYCPDLNPDEYLNCDLKRNVHGQNVAKTQSELEANTRSFMRSLQKTPERGKSYFRNEHISYASSA